MLVSNEDVPMTFGEGSENNFTPNLLVLAELNHSNSGNIEAISFQIWPHQYIGPFFEN
jgi:hypothetical protein